MLQSIQNSTAALQSGSSITAKRVDENACENSARNSQNAVSKCDAGSTCSATEKSSASGVSAEVQQTDMLVLCFAV